MPHLYLIASQYIFDRSARLTQNGTIGCLVAILIIVVLCFIVKPRYYTTRKGREDKYQLGAVLLVLSTIILGIFIYQGRQMDRIRSHAAETTGILTKKKWYSGKGSEWRFAYRFTDAGGTVHDRTRTCSLNSRDIDNAQVDSCYRVVYDTLAPDEAIMDLHAPQHCVPGQ